MGDRLSVRQRGIPSQQRRWRWPEGAGSLVVIAALGTLGGAMQAKDVPVADLLSQARSAYQMGDSERALSLASQAIERNPQNPKSFYVRGWIHEMKRRHRQAIADYDEVVKLDPMAVEVYNRRGSEHFKLGRIEASIADFEKAIELDPKQEPYHWQRGISYYYAGRFQQGRDQFESHQRVNSNDVENAVWHFLCAARLKGVSQARPSILKIKRDSRVPMMEVYRLFIGEGTVEEVMNAARGSESDPDVRKRHLFYANLYLGLYHEAMGDEAQAREHIFLAADRYPLDHYMGDVARVHAEILRRH